VTGANNASDFETTDPKGLARFCYSGTHTGSDTVQAAIGALASTAAKSWRGANRPPAAADDTAEGSQDAPVSIPVSTLTANDSDPDGDPLTVTAVSDATQGSARLAGGSITFTPAAGFAGTASFRYTVGDGRGGNAVATVRLAIKPAEPAGDVAGTSASSLLLACTARKVVLEDVVAMKDRVQLVGVADRSFIGKRVEIVFAPTGKVVARATVLPNGTFSTTAPLPVRSMRKSNRARYLARVGGQRSLNLKLFRRMQVTKLTAANGRVSITGRVIGPLAAKKDRTIVVQRIFSCSKAEEVARVAPRGDGTFTVSVATPKDARAAVYRLQTNVLPDARSRKPVRTFTLPRAVDF
jgi:hypothetical protein